MTSKLEYLKRYMSADPTEQKGKKKKKRRKKGAPVAAARGLVIHDTDAAWVKDEDVDEVAPIVVRQSRLTTEEEQFQKKFQPLQSTDGDGGDGGVAGSVAAANIASRKRARHDSPDASPPRRGRARHDSPDASPPRRGRQRHDSPDASPPRRGRARHDSPDASPPRRGRQRHDSPDASPPRRGRERHDSPDASPPRRGRARQGSLDASPPRRRRTAAAGTDSSPPRRRAAPDSSPPRAPASGLLTASVVKAEALRKVQAEAREVREKGLEAIGLGAETIHRDAAGRRIDPKLARLQQREKETKEREELEKQMEWGRGLVQTRDKEDKLREHLDIMAKPFARTKDDEDMNRFLKDKIHAEDPMAAYMLQKREEAITQRSGAPARPKYKGPPPPPNRFGIPPGFRWDGRNRSNGFEAKAFGKLSSRHARQNQAYRWRSEDM